MRHASPRNNEEVGMRGDDEKQGSVEGRSTARPIRGDRDASRLARRPGSPRRVADFVGAVWYQ
jgi:hypothetical protein